MAYQINPFTGKLDITPFSLDGAGKIPSDYLPSYVDDVVEYDDFASFPGTGETGKIYVAKDTGYTYRWTGSVYVRIGSGGEVNLNLGSEGSPSLYFTGDTNTGLYSPGADQVALSTNGTQRINIEADGDIMQVPPMVSAIKVDGKRLHELAREGEEVEREARPVTVYRFDVTPTAHRMEWRALIECGSGTYVRSLADDLGRALGGGAHIKDLRRTRSGTFGPDDATGVDAFELRPIADIVRDLDRVDVDAATAEKLRHGAFLPEAPEGAGPWAVFSADGELIGVHERNDRGEVRPGVILPTSTG